MPKNRFITMRRYFGRMTDMQKKKERDSLGIMSLKRLSPVEGAVTYSPAFAVPSA